MYQDRFQTVEGEEMKRYDCARDLSIIHKYCVITAPQAITWSIRVITNHLNRFLSWYPSTCRRTYWLLGTQMAFKTISLISAEDRVGGLGKETEAVWEIPGDGISSLCWTAKIKIGWSGWCSSVVRALVPGDMGKAYQWIFLSHIDVLLSLSPPPSITPSHSL